MIIKNVPNKIFLCIGDIDDLVEFDKLDEVTWSTDKINSSDFEYISLEQRNIDVDSAYIMGVINTGGIDMKIKEIERLKELGLSPHEALDLIRSEAKKTKE